MEVTLTEARDKYGREIEVTNEAVEVRFGRVGRSRFPFEGDDRITAWSYVPGDRRLVLLRDGVELLDTEFRSDEDADEVATWINNAYTAAVDIRRGVDPRQPWRSA